MEHQEAAPARFCETTKAPDGFDPFDRFPQPFLGFKENFYFRDNRLLIVYDGKIGTITQWSRLTGISNYRIHSRIHMSKVSFDKVFDKASLRNTRVSASKPKLPGTKPATRRADVRLVLLDLNDEALKGKAFKDQWGNVLIECEGSYLLASRAIKELGINAYELRNLVNPTARSPQNNKALKITYEENSIQRYKKASMVDRARKLKTTLEHTDEHVMANLGKRAVPVMRADPHEDCLQDYPDPKLSYMFRTGRALSIIHQGKIGNTEQWAKALGERPVHYLYSRIKKGYPVEVMLDSTDRVGDAIDEHAQYPQPLKMTKSSFAYTGNGPTYLAHEGRIGTYIQWGRLLGVCHRIISNEHLSGRFDYKWILSPRKLPAGTKALPTKGCLCDVCKKIRMERKFESLIEIKMTHKEDQGKFFECSDYNLYTRYNGELMTFREFALAVGKPYTMLYERIMRLGWKVEDAVRKEPLKRKARVYKNNMI